MIFIKVLLESTLRILREYVYKIKRWKDYGPRDRKLHKGTRWLTSKFFGLEEEEIKKIRSKIKFVNQWLFIEVTKDIVITGLGQTNKLKMAEGKFVPWSEARKWYRLNFVNIIQYSIEII